MAGDYYAGKPTNITDISHTSSITGEEGFLPIDDLIAAIEQADSTYVGREVVNINGTDPKKFRIIAFDMEIIEELVEANVKRMREVRKDKLEIAKSLLSQANEAMRDKSEVTKKILL